MSRFIRHEVHPRNPQARLLKVMAAQLCSGAVAALPTAGGYVLACRLDDKAAADRLRRHARPGSRAPAALLCRDLAQAAGWLQIGDQAFRTIRAGGDGSQAYALRVTRRVPRRLSADAGGVSLLHFAGDGATQALLEMLAEPLLIAPPAAVAMEVDALAACWPGMPDVALDVGALPAARAVQLVDLGDALRARPSLPSWLGVAPVPA